MLCQRRSCLARDGPGAVMWTCQAGRRLVNGPITGGNRLGASWTVERCLVTDVSGGDRCLKEKSKSLHASWTGLR